jgi:hypothetical protein
VAYHIVHHIVASIAAFVVVEDIVFVLSFSQMCECALFNCGGTSASKSNQMCTQLASSCFATATCYLLFAFIFPQVNTYTSFNCLHLLLYFSTRVIKPNQQDIGRKIVTKKPTSIVPSAYNNRTTTSSTSLSNGVSTATPNNSSTSSSSNSLKRSLDVTNDNGNTNSMSHFTSQQQQQQQQQIPAISSHNSYNSQDHHHDSYHHHQSSHHNNALNGVVVDDMIIDHHQRMPSNMGHNLNRNNGQQNHRYPDIMKKPIK